MIDGGHRFLFNGSADFFRQPKGAMRAARIRIRKVTPDALRELGDAFARAWKSGKGAGDIFEFESPRALFRMLSPKRWELVETLQAAGPSSLRALARRLGRDAKRVNEDAAALIQYGLIARNDTGKLFVPYEVIHIDFALRATAA